MRNARHQLISFSELRNLNVVRTISEAPAYEKSSFVTFTASVGIINQSRYVGGSFSLKLLFSSNALCRLSKVEFSQIARSRI
jgi:hypothetical protein